MSAIRCQQAARVRIAQPFYLSRLVSADSISRSHPEAGNVKKYLDIVNGNYYVDNRQAGTARSVQSRSAKDNECEYW